MKKKENNIEENNEVEKRAESKKTILKIKSKKNLISLLVCISIMIVLLGIFLFSKRENTNIGTITPEIMRSTTYAQVEDGDEKVDGTDYVEFDAFFLRDLNGDGYAESIRGTCREVGKEDTLYMELNVLTNGRLENGVITINSDNFYLQTAIPKDNEIKGNAIGTNIKRIELNTVNNGTQKLLTGIVKSGDYSYESTKTAAIGNDITKYSRVNSITLTGTYIADDESRTEINKTVEFNVDWYGDVSASIVSYMGNYDYKNQKKDISDILDEENKSVNLNFSIRTRENKNELILKRSYIEGTIPQLNGYDPISVAVTGTNVTYTYDEETKKFTAQREAVLNESNILTSIANDTYDKTRYNEYNLEIKYPLEAYESLGADTVEIKIPVKTYYEGYNNSNEEFKNPAKSNIVGDIITVSFRKPEGEAAAFDIYVGKYSSRPYYRYWISKEKPLKIYNQIVSEELNDEYLVKWIGSTGSEGESSGMIMKETANGTDRVTDKFIKSDAEEINIGDLTENVAIYFDNPVSLLGEDGWIKVYDDETDALIETFTKANWGKYSKITPYWYEFPIKHIRIETSATNKLSSLYVYNIKELNDSYITENYTREEFDNLKYIKSTLSGYLGGKYINTDIHQAYYEAPISDLSAYISVPTMSTQGTLKNAVITLSTNCIEEYNEVKWQNGSFLLKMPKEIIDVTINSVEIDNENVKIISYEKYEENEELYIKILTSNNNPESYEIKLDLDITPDPRSVTTNKNIEVYSSNENSVDYYSPQADIYDVNNNLNTQENVQKNDIYINLISPNSLLTNQIATDYDDKGSTVIAPQIGIIEVDQKTATLNISLTNNYNSTISDVKLLGRVPFEGNKYVISNGDMGSTYTTVMTNAGISVPDELKEYVKVYYTEVEDATQDLNNEQNGWTETPLDFSKVKCYLIDLENYVLKTGEVKTFCYTINILDNVNYNDISYSDYAVYFSLDTENGKYKTKTEPNKLGLMIAKKYNLQITKNKLGNDSKFVPGATYSLETSNTVGGEGTRTATTDPNGVLEFKDLYVKKEYTLREIKSPDNYVLSDDIVKFTTDIDNNGNLTFQVTEGEFKDTPNVLNNEDIKVQAKLEDDIKYDFNIDKVDLDGNPAKGVAFKISSKEMQKTIKTGTNGKINFKGLIPGVEYTLEEVDADGYYRVFDKTKFTVIRKNGVLKLETDNDILKKAVIVENEENDKAQVSVQIRNEKIPTYNFELLKIEKGDETQKGLAKARYELTSVDTGDVSYYNTDENGKINVANLYQYINGKYLTGEYTLKEITPPNGYVTSKDVIRFKVFKNDSDELQFEILNEDETTSIRSREIEGTTFKLVLEDRPQFTLTKLDSETNNVLAGAKFAIYKVDKNKVVLDFAKDVYGNYIGEYEDGYYLVTTDENGQIKLALPGGYYKSVEIVSPEGYKLPERESSRTEYFTIDGAEDETTYEISKIEDLVAFSNSVNAGDTYSGKTVTLLNSLDFASEESYRNPLDKRFGDLNGDGTVKGVMEELVDTAGKGFTPIGRSSSYSFNGVFEGNGNEIKNIYIESNNENVGLFGYANNNSIIQNLNISGNISSIYKYSGYLGGIAGYTAGKINNCTNNCMIICDVEKSSSTYMGGIAGYAYIILSSSNNENILSETSQGTVNMGGIAGISSKIINAYNTGNLTANSTGRLNIAGITTSNALIKNTYNIGNINGTGTTINTGYISSYSGKLSNMDNSYYLSDILLIDGSTQNMEGISKTSDEMKTQDFVSLLNSYYNSWKMDINNINNGYPILDPTSNLEDFKIIEINYIEDLVQLSKIVNDGLFTYENETVELKRTLDFNDDNFYKNPNNTIFGDLNKNGIVEGIKAELTNESGIGFTPIGIGYNNYFKGNFEGNENEIKNIYINSEEEYVGLFGYKSNGQIRNISIDGNIISNCSETYSAYLGGIAGFGNNLIIKRCCNKANIEYRGTSFGDIGGIIGRLDEGKIYESYNIGKIENKVFMKENDIGGISGCVIGCEITSNFNTGDIIDEISESSYLGGIIGTATIRNSEIFYNYNIGNIIGRNYVGPISGTLSELLFRNNYYLNTIIVSGDRTIRSTEQDITEEEMKSDMFIDLLNSGEVAWQKDINLINNGYPLPNRNLVETEYIAEINSIEDLVEFSKQVNSGYSYKDKNVILNTTLDFESDESYENPNDTSYGDINGNGILESIKQELTNKSSSGFIPLGGGKRPFEGNFDGNGYELQNIHIKSYNSYVGLFGNVIGNICNLSVSGNIYSINDISTGDVLYLGAIVGKLDGDIKNCENRANVESSCIGSYSYYDESYIGCLVGQNTGSIECCKNYGNISIYGFKMGNDDYYIGGISGDSNKISNSYNRGTISILSSIFRCMLDQKVYIGGISGRAQNIENCYNNQDININTNGQVNYGGFGGGSSEILYLNVGGIVGSASMIKSSYNLGDLNINYTGKAETTNYGGYTQEVETCIGGIAGKGSVLNCYSVSRNILFNLDLQYTSNAPREKISSYIGSLVGYRYSSASGYYLNNIKFEGSTQTNLSGTSKTETEMKSENFVNLLNTEAGNENTWKFVEGNYPTLNMEYNSSQPSEDVKDVLPTEMDIKNEILKYRITTDIILTENSNTHVEMSSVEDEQYKWNKNEDGVYCSGNYNINSSTSTIKSNEIELTSESLLSFDWTVSSESASYDYLYYTITNTETNEVIGGTSTKIGGTSYGTVYDKLTWKNKTIELQSGKYVLSFTYRKDGSVNSGLDTAYVKNIRIVEKGGTITGEGESPYEVVVYNNNSVKPIEIVPDDGFAIEYIIVNGEKISYEANEDGTYVLPQFENITENKHIEVKFSSTIGQVVEKHLLAVKNEDGTYTFTDTELSKPKTITGQDKENYTTAPEMNLENYELISKIVDDEKEYIIPDGSNIPYESAAANGKYEAKAKKTVIYYYVEKEIPLTVHHYIEGTTQPVELNDGTKAEDIKNSGTEGTEYSTNALDNIADKYELVSMPENANGTYGSSEVVVTYYYKIKKLNIATEVKKHTETDYLGVTKEVSGGKISGENESVYEQVIYGKDSIKEIVAIPDEGYEVKSITVNDEQIEFTPNEDGTVTLNNFINMLEDKNVVVEFRKKQGTLTVHHYIEETEVPVPLKDGTLAENENKSGDVGDIYATKPVENLSEKYELAEDPSNSSGEYIEGNIEVIYYYTLKDTRVTVHHYKAIENEDGTYTYTEERLSEDVIVQGKVDDEYTTTVSDDIMEYCELVQEPENKNGIMTIEPIEVIYYYKLKEYNYKVNYLEKETNNVLHDQKQGENHVYGTEIISNDEVIEIDGYNYDSVDKEKLTITTNNETNVINIYYIKRTDLSYEVKYLEEGTNKELHEPKNETNQIFGSQITENAEKINGYNVSGESIKEITITTGKNEIIFYYTKRTDLEYTVEYYYDGVIDDSKTETFTATYQDIVENYTDKNITGYKLEKTENLPLTVSEYPLMNVIKVYYVKDKYTYTVNYYYDGVINESKTEIVSATYQDIIDTYTDKTEYGYEFEKVENLPLTISEKSEDNIINVYYVRKDATCTVKYMDKNTGEEISEEVTKEGKVFEEFDVSEDQKEIEGYTLVESPTPTTGTYTEEPQTKTYYYARNTKVIVKHLEKDDTSDDDTDNQVLADEEIIEGYIGKEYIAKPKDINNYTFVESTDNITGEMTEEVITVICYYLQNTKVIVNHIDKNTDEILETIEEEGLIGDEYTSVSKEFEGYVLVETPENETVTMTKEVITLNYYYVKVSAGVVEKHVNIVTGEVLYNELHEGNEGDSYSTSSKEFENYEIVTNKMYYSIDKNLLAELGKYTEEEQEELKLAHSVSTLEELVSEYKEAMLDKIFADKELKAEDAYIPENHEGIMTTELIEVVYYYIRPASVKVEYIDEITGENISEDIIIKGHEGDEYKTQEKDINDYSLVEEKYPSNANGTMKVTVNEDGTICTETIVKYYYVHTANVVERHMDIKTNKLLEDEKTYSGHESDLYSTSSKTFEGYDLVKEQLPENAEGKMTKDEIIVNYYYIRKADVVVEYIDKNTGKNLLEITKVKDDSENDITTEKDSTEHIYGHEGDAYKTKEKKFDNYKLIETTDNTEGEMKVTVNEDGTVNTTTYVKYYYAHVSSGVIEKHIDVITGELLEDETKYEGCEGDKYSTSSKTFEKYDLVKEKLPENAEGTMTKEEIEVKYYYIRKVKVTVEYLELDTNKKLAEDEIIDGHEGDSYKTSSKNITGYSLVTSKLPSNATGTMEKTDIKVTYWYKANPATTEENKSNSNNTEIIIITDNTKNTVTPSSTNKASNTSNAPKAYYPATGDMLPIIAVGIIFVVVILNVIQIVITKSKSKKEEKKNK